MSRTHATSISWGTGNGERGTRKIFQMRVRWPRARFLAFMSGDGAHSKQKDEANHEHEESLSYGSGDYCCHVRFRTRPPRRMGTSSPSPPPWPRPRGRHRRPDCRHGRTCARHHSSGPSGLHDTSGLSRPRGCPRAGRRARPRGRRAHAGSLSGPSRLPARIPPILVIAHGETAAFLMAFLIYYACFSAKGHAYK